MSDPRRLRLRLTPAELAAAAADVRAAHRRRDVSLSARLTQRALRAACLEAAADPLDPAGPLARLVLDSLRARRDFDRALTAAALAASDAADARLDAAVADALPERTPR